MLAMIQRKLIYFPDRVDSLKPANINLSPERFHQLALKVSDQNTIHGWHILPPGRAAMDETERHWELEKNRPVILFFSGNAGHRGYRAEELNRLSQLNADLFIFDYRGYGDNAGVPSEKKLAEDARAVWDYLVNEEQIASERILLLGESLGTGVATHLAFDLAQEKVELKGLFLKTPFSSLVDVACYHYPFVPCRLLLTERYLNSEKIPSISCPITILHGIHDEVIPFALAQKLFDLAPETSTSGVPKKFVELPVATHNDILQTEGKTYLNAVREML